MAAIAMRCAHSLEVFLLKLYIILPCLTNFTKFGSFEKTDLSSGALQFHNFSSNF